MRTMDVVPYDQDWKVRYEREKTILFGILGEIIIGMEHIGSTSVDGLLAKPIIDIAVYVKNIDDVDLYNERMPTAGYDVRGEHGMPGRRYFVRFKSDDSGNHTHHIHIYHPDNQAAKDALVFRDFLRVSEAARNEYSDAKLALSQKYYTEPLAYTNGKTDCVLRILVKAREYYRDKV